MGSRVVGCRPQSLGATEFETERESRLDPKSPKP